MERNTPIEYILLSNYIKYEELQRLTLEAFYNSNAEVVNVYIDLANMLNSIYQSGVRIENYSVITSTVVNLCAHIRSYYRSRHRVETNIFIIYSTNDSNSNRKFYLDYNKSHNAKLASKPQIHDIVLSNLKLLNILTPYLPDIYFRYGTFEPGVIIYDTIIDQTSKGNNYPNIILSKDLYMYQLPAMLNNTVLFRKKSDGRSYSVRLTNNIYRYFYDSRNKECANLDARIHGSLLSLLITMTNLPSRNIYALLDTNTALKLINKSVLETGSIPNLYTMDMEYVYTVLNDIRTLNIDMVTFCNRFKAIDVRYQHMIFQASPESKVNYILNLNDPNSVREINNKYFKTNPLDLNRL